MTRPPTPSQTVGPFFGFAMPFPGDAEADADGIRIQGQVLDGEGQPVPDAILELWAGDQFARCRTDSEGAYGFRAGRPVAKGAKAPHFELTVFARGLLRQLATRIYLPDEEAANAADPALAAVPPDRRDTLVARGEGGVLTFDVHLQGDRETVFFAL
jgi:protocatechuate 3,4-dioxygenase, alpha subunit